MADKGDDLTDEVYQAVIMQAEGRTAEAETAFRAVLEKSPAHPDALHFLGLLQYQKGNADEAVTLIDEAIAADGDSPIYAVNLGKVLVDLERLGEAEEAFRRALRLQPDEAELHFLLGETLRPRRK
ncbi:MAG: tetratricopeptide repeat protein, partial [Rhodospirillales bacterium]